VSHRRESRIPLESRLRERSDRIGRHAEYECGYIIGRVHAHVTLANAGKASGGHLEAGTEVLTFAVVKVGVRNDGLDLTRVDGKIYR
jgi:hypothetical protein